MKCPHCGEETQEGKSCDKCGRDLARPQMEVRYRDFKVTEMLDIKMPGQAPSGKEAGKPRVDKRISEDSRRQEKQSAGKGPRLALVAVLIFLAAACGYYLLKLLMKF